MIRKQIDGVVFELSTPSALHCVALPVMLAYNGRSWLISAKGEATEIPSRAFGIELIKKGLMKLEAAR